MQRQKSKSNSNPFCIYVNRSRSFFYSLSIHAILIALGAGAYYSANKPEPKPVKIPIKLLDYTVDNSAVLSDAKPIIPPKAVPVQTISHVPKTPLNDSKQNDPVVIQPPKPPAPTAAEPSPAPTASAPKTQQPVPETPRIVPQPPAIPAPPVNVQARYEEENLGLIRTILSERLVYPKNALRLHQQGDVIVSFMLSPEKEITGLTITKSSEFELLDDAARRLIETSASEFPKPAKTVKITVPIGYKIR